MRTLLISVNTSLYIMHTIPQKWIRRQRRSSKPLAREINNGLQYRGLEMLKLTPSCSKVLWMNWKEDLRNTSCTIDLLPVRSIESRFLMVVPFSHFVPKCSRLFTQLVLMGLVGLSSAMLVSTWGRHCWDAKRWSKQIDNSWWSTCQHTQNIPIRTALCISFAWQKKNRTYWLLYN